MKPHKAAGYLCPRHKITISHEELETIKWKWPEERDDMEVWKEWARVGRVRAQDYLQALKLKMEAQDKPSQRLIREFRHFSNLSRKLSDIAICRPDEWVCDTWNYGHQFDPLKIAEYAERYLYHGVRKVILTSGTIVPRTLTMMGIDMDDFDYFDYAAREIGDTDRSPLIFIPTTFVSRNSGQEELIRLTERVDEIMEMECEHRGIIHTGNFEIRDFIYTHSKYQKLMVSNWTAKGDLTANVIRQYKETPAPVALISPSVTTGYDFMGDYCRYQIIAKLPFPNLKATKVDRERERDDPNLGIYMMWQSLAQEFGRGDRADDDWQHVYIIDNNIEKAILRYSDLAPPGLLEYYRKSLVVPLFDGMRLAQR